MGRWFPLGLIMLGIWGFAQSSKPNVVIVTVDTLRADHMGSYGYQKNTSPHIDRLLRDGIRFSNARTIEPLTAPSLCSMITGIYPHEHGASRNGLPLFPDLISVNKLFKLSGYHTAGFVANWTLRDRLTGLAEHFVDYEEVFTRKRWFGLFLSESDATDITERAIKWLANHRHGKPFFMWVHYVEPHAPYRFQKDVAAQVGLANKSNPSKKERYDTEIAFVDRSIGHFLEKLYRYSKPENTIIVFASDHGESLGEHNYWGHGRHLYEPTLHIPMGIVWKGKIKPGVEDAPATLLDIPSTLLGLVAKPVPPSFKGFDWAPVFLNGQTAAMDRVTYYQAHKGAVQTKSGIEKGRQRGLLEVGILENGQKEVFQVRGMDRLLFDIANDPEELNNLAAKDQELTERLKQWALEVEKGLNLAKGRQGDLRQSDIEMLRSLGYID